ncbi:halocyanin domain-containing protein [Salinigranum sp. GCM10025319]|uniref:halocyanin domain-containing protein n=1 Tax=Salinigranum sp. GCM10025319 TaxID=3252687 RepID=UPI00361DDC33
MHGSPTRRRVLLSSALVALGSTVGCLSTAAPEGDAPDETATSTTDPTASATSTETNPAAETDAPADESTPTETTSTPSSSLDEWLADANGYRGEIARRGPGSRPTITVGHPTDDGLAFDPPAIEVAPMTMVRWDWAGHGGQHNVVALDGTFDSGRTNAQPGTGYHYVFEEPGEYRFVSEPHRDEGMRGVVVVREPPSTGNEAVDAWVVDSSNFDGTMTDRTGADAATVTVGAAGNRGHFAFDPPVLKVSRGTTVTWEWTGEGGGHNVAFEELDVASDEVTPDPDTTFEYTFESTGTYRYACEPHHALGMKGAVVVV